MKPTQRLVRPWTALLVASAIASLFLVAPPNTDTAEAGPPPERCQRKEDNGKVREGTQPGELWGCFCTVYRYGPRTEVYSCGWIKIRDGVGQLALFFEVEAGYYRWQGNGATNIGTHIVNNQPVLRADTYLTTAAGPYNDPVDLPPSWLAVKHDIYVTNPSNTAWQLCRSGNYLYTYAGGSSKSVTDSGTAYTSLPRSCQGQGQYFSTVAQGWGWSGSSWKGGSTWASGAVIFTPYAFDNPPPAPPPPTAAAQVPPLNPEDCPPEMWGSGAEQCP